MSQVLVQVDGKSIGCIDVQHPINNEDIFNQVNETFLECRSHDCMVYIPGKLVNVCTKPFDPTKPHFTDFWKKESSGD